MDAGGGAALRSCALQLCTASSERHPLIRPRSPSVLRRVPPGAWTAEYTPDGLTAQFHCRAMARARSPSKPGSAWSIQTYYRCTVSLTTSARSTSSCTEHPRGARQLVSESCTSAVYVCCVRSFYVNVSLNLLSLVYKLTTPSMAALLHASVDAEPYQGRSLPRAPPVGAGSRITEIVLRIK